MQQTRVEREIRATLFPDSDYTLPPFPPFRNPASWSLACQMQRQLTAPQHDVPCLPAHAPHVSIAVGIQPRPRRQVPCYECPRYSLSVRGRRRIGVVPGKDLLHACTKAAILESRLHRCRHQECGIRSEHAHLASEDLGDELSGQQERDHSPTAHITFWPIGCVSTRGRLSRDHDPPSVW